MTRLAWRGGGVLLLLIGCVWILQGFALVPGTFMYGDPVWSVVGLAFALAGAAVVLGSVLT